MEQPATMVVVGQALFPRTVEYNDRGGTPRSAFGASGNPAAVTEDDAMHRPRGHKVRTYD